MIAARSRQLTRNRGAAMTKRYVPTTRRDWLLSVLVITGLVMSLLVGVWLFGPPWGVLAMLVVAGAIVFWHARTTAYRCAHCGAEFEISLARDLISPHGVFRAEDGALRGWQLLRCPACRRWSRATVLRVERSDP
jgi:hypothetical protein